MRYFSKTHFLRIKKVENHTQLHATHTHQRKHHSFQICQLFAWNVIQSAPQW